MNGLLATNKDAVTPTNPNAFPNFAIPSGNPTAMYLAGQTGPSVGAPGPTTAQTITAGNAAANANGTPTGTTIPDYATLIQQDPALIQAEADLRASDISNLAQRNAAFQRDVIDYGQLPDLNTAASRLGLGATDLTGILGPDIGKLAQENTSAGTSALARLNALNQQQIGRINNALAARGIYNSGELGYQQGQQAQNYTNSQYDQTQKLLDAMAGQQGSYLQAYQQLQMALAQALSDAANRALQLYPPTTGGSGGTTGGGGGGAAAPELSDPYAGFTYSRGGYANNAKVF